MRFVLALAMTALAALHVTAGTALAQSLPVQPDARLTPGAVASADPAEVCGYVDGLTYSRRHRIWRDKRDTLAKYGLPWADHGLVEDDDRVPVCLGGDNGNPRNHWPEPLAQAHEKDRLEAEVCRLVCDDRAMTLQAGQEMFLGDWRVGYRQVFGEGP